jgi:two-component system chemotaxis response regulator CheY
MDAKIIEASDVGQALAVCSLSMPDAIFVDASMPTLDGCEFLRRLRRMQGGDGPTAIICLNENGVTQIARAMHAGASDFMMKPFDADHVRAKFAFESAREPSPTSAIPSRANRQRFPARRPVCPTLPSLLRQIRTATVGAGVDRAAQRGPRPPATRSLRAQAPAR